MQRTENKYVGEDVKVLQSTTPSWAIDTENKLVGLEDRSKRNSLITDVIKKTWKGNLGGWHQGPCISKVFELLKNNLEININDVVIECAHRTRARPGSKPRAIVVQFTGFYSLSANPSNGQHTQGLALNGK